MSQVSGNDVVVWVDPVKGKDANAIVGDHKYPAKTFGKAMSLLLGSQIDRGSRVMRIINNGLTPAILPPEPTGSLGTAGLFAWGGLGPLGLDAVPIVIESDFIPQTVPQIPVGQVLNVITLDVETPVTLNQYRGSYMTDETGAVRYLVLSNTANGGAGNVDFTLNAVPGDIFPGFSGLVSVVQVGAEIQLPVDGEYAFEDLVFGMQGIRWNLQGTLSFRNCEAYCQGVNFFAADTGALSLDASLMNGTPFQVFEKWDGVVGTSGSHPVNPFLDTRLGAMYAQFGTTNGGIFETNGSEIRGPLTVVKGFLELSGRSQCTLRFANLLDADLNIFGESLFQSFGQSNTRNQLDIHSASVTVTARSNFRADLTDIGNATIDLSQQSVAFFGDVGTIMGETPAATAFKLTSMSTAVLTTATTFIGTTGVAKVETQTVAAYANITANADPPANAGMFVGTIQAAVPQVGLGNGCIIEILP